MSDIHTQDDPPSFAFDEHAEQVIGHFRSAFADIIAALPGQIRRPHELSRVLGIDKKLGWKISNVVHSPDPFEAASHVPGVAGIRIFLNAAKKQKVPLPLIKAASSAMKDFDRLIEIHAGDRASLEMMLASCARSGRERVDLEHRRAAFRANSYLWGIQARVQLRVNFLHPSVDEELFDLVSLRGFIGLRWIRADAPWTIYRSKVVDDDGVQRRAFIREPLAASDGFDGDAIGVPLLHEFCTHPLPKLRAVASEPGFVNHEIIEGPAGDTAAVTCIMGDVARSGAPRYREEHNRVVELVARCNTPSETLVFDQLVHKSLFGEMNPALAAYSELAGTTPPLSMQHARFRLPLSESVQRIGRGPSVLHTPDVPRYAEMARFVFDKMGWAGDDFDVYRVTVQYPPIPTAIVVSDELPERPEA